MQGQNFTGVRHASYCTTGKIWGERTLKVKGTTMVILSTRQGLHITKEAQSFLAEKKKSPPQSFIARLHVLPPPQGRALHKRCSLQWCMVDKYSCHAKSQSLGRKKVFCQNIFLHVLRPVRELPATVDMMGGPLQGFRQGKISPLKWNTNPSYSLAVLLLHGCYFELFVYFGQSLQTYWHENIAVAHTHMQPSLRGKTDRLACISPMTLFIRKQTLKKKKKKPMHLQKLVVYTNYANQDLDQSCLHGRQGFYP